MHSRAVGANFTAQASLQVQVDEETEATSELRLVSNHSAT